MRNPHFHEWSRAARPDGYPDAITVKFGLPFDAATTAVERGRLDYTPHLPAERISEVATRYSSQLHVNAVSATNALIMNTRISPFDSEDARRAVSYALDRSEILQRTGSAEFAQPTCQILPPNFPGYKPYCPYTLVGAQAGTWRAPDFVMAQRLIARSHTRGMRVTVLGTTDAYPGGQPTTSFSSSTGWGTGPRANSFPIPSLARAVLLRLTQAHADFSGQWSRRLPLGGGGHPNLVQLPRTDERLGILRSKTRR